MEKNEEIWILEVGKLLFSYLLPPISKAIHIYEQDMRNTAEEARTNT